MLITCNLKFLSTFWGLNTSLKLRVVVFLRMVVVVGRMVVAVVGRRANNEHCYSNQHGSYVTHPPN